MDNRKIHQIITFHGKNQKTHYLPRAWESASERPPESLKRLNGGSPPKTRADDGRDCYRIWLIDSNEKTGSWNNKGQVAVLNFHEWGNDSYRKYRKGDLAHRKLWRWLIEQSIPRGKIDGQLSRVVLSLTSRKNCVGDWKTEGTSSPQKSQSLPRVQTWGSFQTMTEEVAGSIEGRTLNTTVRMYANNSPSPFPKRYMPFTWATALGEYPDISRSV